MPLLTWNEEYNLGHHAIDEQHQGLLTLINKLHEALAIGESRSVLSEIFDGLKRYVREHFSMEEELMRNTQFPGREAHLREHASFCEKVDQMFLHFLQSASFLIGIELMRFLSAWVEEHMQQADQVYMLHLRSQQKAVLA